MKEFFISMIKLNSLLRLTGCLMLSLPSWAFADYGPGDPVYDLWAQYYVQEKTDPVAAESTLIKLTQAVPDHADVWKSLTYLRLRENKKKEALDALLVARKLQPQDEQLALQEAYLRDDLKQKKEALALFEQLSHSSDAKTAKIACQAVANLKPQVNRVTTPPYFADIYASPSYEGRFDDGVIPLKARYGRYFDDNRGQVYTFLTINRDTRSRGGARPEIFDENAAILGVGANYQVFRDIPILAYAETGGSYDLIDQNRSRFRGSLVAGLTGYQEWGDTAPYCGTACRVPLTPYADLYGNVATYSRENYDVLGDFRLRGGFNLLQSPLGRVQAYLKLHNVSDTKNTYYDNIFEFGPGLAYTLPNGIPLVFRFESLSGRYLKGTGGVAERDTYHNNRIELTYYKSF